MTPRTPFVRAVVLAAIAVATTGIAASQTSPGGQPATTLDDAAGAARPGTGPAPRPSQAAQATREFLGLGVVPDAAAAARGAPVFAQNCGGCHGSDARGGIGPSLIYSTQVLDDDHGEKLAVFLKVGRPERGMPSFADTAPRDLTDIAEYLHAQVEAYANRGIYQNNNDILTGDARKGAAFFVANCTACHAVSGNLKGVGARYRPLDLQRNLLMPVREGHPARAVQAVVTTPDGKFAGRVAKIDDFEVSVVDAAGVTHDFERGHGVTVAMTDPLAWHTALAGRIKDSEMTDLTTYLASVK